MTEITAGDWSAPAIAADLVVAGTTDNAMLAFDRSTGQQRWSFALDDTGFTDPVITGDLVLASEGNHLNQEGKRKLRAIGLDSGSERWSFTASGRLLVSPAAGDGTVYIITVPGMLYALGEDRSAVSITNYRGDLGRRGVTSDPPIGSPPTVRWQRSFGQDADAPIVADGVLYLGVEGSGLVAVDGLTGADVWSVDIGRVFAPVSVADGVVFCGTASNGVHAIDVTTATSRWNTSLGGMIIGNTFVVGDRVYAASPAGMHALDVASGAIVWEHGVRATNVVATPAADEGTLYFGIDRTFYAIDRATDEERWSVEVGGVMGVSVANGLVYATSSDGLLHALDAATGDERWRFAGSDIFWSAVSATDASLFVGNSDHFVYALDALTGAELWRFETGDWVLSDPILAGDVLYVGTGTHMEESGARPVYAIDATTGAEIWRFETTGLIHAGLTIANGLLYVVTTGGDLYALG